MENLEDLLAYCKKLGEYYVHRYAPTKLEMLNVASIKRVSCKLDGHWYDWDAILPHKFRADQIEKLLSFKISMQFAMNEVFEWVLNFMFPELGGKKAFFTHFAWDSLFWLLNLEYYKRKQRTIFQDYQMPSFDWDALEFWLAEGYQMIQNRETKVLIRAELDNIGKKLDEYRKEVMQIAADAVAYL